MPVNDPRYWPDSDPAAYNRYVASMVAAVRQLAERRYRVVFFSTHPSDEWVMDDIRAGLPADGIVEVVRPRDTATLAAFVRSADVVLATRFHGILFALACCRPVLGVCYYRKSRELMAAAGMEQFAIDIDTIDPSALVAKVERLLEDAPMIVPQLALHAAMQRRELETQYAQLVDLWAPELRSVAPAAHLPSDLDDGRREAR
jgi:polysaccharide pyruvyl transferase WcaK-like protein